MALDADVRREHLLERALVEFLVREGDREGFDRRGGDRFDDRGGHRRIDAAAQIRGDRHVRPQPQPGRVGQQVTQLLRVLVLRLIRIVVRVEIEIPVLTDANGAVLPHDHRVPGRQLMHAGERRARRQRHPEGEDLCERLMVEIARHALVCEERLDLGRKQQRVAGARVEQRPDADAIARQKQPPLACIPDGERPLSVEPLDALLPPRVVGVQEDFGVGACGEPVSQRRQFLAKLEVVEDLAVECDRQPPAGGEHRLRAAFDVDDAQTRVSERHRAVAVDGARVGAPVTERGNHLGHSADVRGTVVEVNDSGNSAHGLVSVPSLTAQGASGIPREYRLHRPRRRNSAAGGGT